MPQYAAVVAAVVAVGVGSCCCSWAEAEAVATEAVAASAASATAASPALAATAAAEGPDVGSGAADLVDAGDAGAIGVELPQHSVSGISSGADMAVNHFVAFSGSTTGAAIAAGAPYGCNVVERFDDKCGVEIFGADWSRILPRLAKRLSERAASGLIDPLELLKGKRLYLYSGTEDMVVARGVMEAVRNQLGDLIGDLDGAAGALSLDYGVNSAHGWVVDGHSCGPGEPGSNTSWCQPCCCSAAALLACEGHDLSGRLLRHLLRGKMGSSRSPALAPLIAVPQAPYVAKGRTLDDSGLWHTAYVYAPMKCRIKGHSCNIHVHYHGCVWGAEYTGTDVIMRLGLVDWAEAAEMIFIFPQSSSTIDTGGCWDWTGETGELFDTKQGAQLAMVASMLEDLPRILHLGQNADLAVESDKDGTPLLV